MLAYLKKFSQTESFYLLLIFTVSVVIMLPVLFKGIPFGYDLPHHYQCAMTFVESIQNGDWYPSWSLNRNFGFGGMESRLYPPISHYTLALAYLVFHDWHLASFFIFIFYTFIGGLGVYLWAKEYVPAGQAVFAGIIYILLPYHLNQLYNTFFYAEYVGSCVLPFSFLFLSRVCRRGRSVDVIGLTVAYAVLILTHLPLTVVGSLCLGIYGLSLLKREQFFGQITKLGISVFGGLAASSFFWTKVLTERHLMAKTLIYEDPWLDYRLHFLLTPIQTFTGELRERIFETATFYYDLMLLAAVVLAISCTLPFLLFEKKSQFSMKGIWILFGISVFLIVPFSKPVWDILPFLQEVQFPWRWVAVVSIFASVLAASQINFLLEWFYDMQRRRYSFIVCGCILSVIAFSTSQIVRQAPHIETKETKDYMEKNSKDIGFTFWWTIWTKKEIFENKERVTLVDREFEIKEWSAIKREISIREGRAQQIRIGTFYHPNWHAEIDGSSVETKPDDNGSLLVGIPDQKSNLVLKFTELPIVQAGKWFSLATWLILLALCLSKFSGFLKINSKKKNLDDLWEVLRKIYHLPIGRNKTLVLVAVSLLSLSPTIFFGLFEGGDLPQHLQIAGSFQFSLSEAILYPSWGGFENSGYGSTAVRFYPPIFALLSGFFKLVCGNWLIAILLVLLIFNFLGGLGTYLWAKEFQFSDKAIWAGIIFILMPYHLFEIHNSSMFAEFGGISVITFSFLFVTKICRQNEWKYVLALGISYGILLLTHLPTTVIGSISLFIYGLFILPKKQIFATLFKLICGVCLGLSLSSVYWTRMIFEREWMRNTKFWKDDHFTYNANFLLQTFGFDDRQLWLFGLMLLSLLMLVSAAAFILYQTRRRSDRQFILSVSAIFFLAVFMTTFFSQPIWDNVKFLQEIQFPWRWLTIASLTGSVLIAGGLENLPRILKNTFFSARTVKICLIGILTFFVSVYGIIWIGFQQGYNAKPNFDDWATETASGLGQEWFWTVITKPEVFKVSDKISSSGRSYEIHKWTIHERFFSVGEGSAGDVRLATLYYPHWKATVNGQETPVSADENGAMILSIPAQKSEIRVWFEEPQSVKFASFLSAILWVTLVSAALFWSFSSIKKLRKDS